MDKVMIFFDGSNLMYSSVDVGEGFKIDYLKLVKELAAGRQVIRSYFFDAVPPAGREGNDTKLRFMDFLRYNGITVIPKELKYRTIKCEDCHLADAVAEKLKDGHTLSSIKSVEVGYQKGVDVALVTELIKMARENAFDVGIVVSGDNDYSSGVECVKSMGKRVEVASFRRSLGHDLRQSADRLIILNDLADRIKLEGRPKGR